MRVPGLVAIFTGLSLTVTACQGGGGEARIPVDSTEYYRTQVQNLATISSEKDSLLRDLTETTRSSLPSRAPLPPMPRSSGARE
jgi:hypothetical protein